MEWLPILVSLNFNNTFFIYLLLSVHLNLVIRPAACDINANTRNGPLTVPNAPIGKLDANRLIDKEYKVYQSLTLYRTHMSVANQYAQLINVWLSKMFACIRN
jgi:hypothetical protein